jgi:hypothetical protein
VKLHSSILNNYGRIDWTAGAIDVGNAPSSNSSLVNHSGGTFSIYSSGPLAATPGSPERNVGSITNNGTVRFYSSSIRIAADYTNDGGTTQVYGNVQFDYNVVHSSGVLELRSGTVKLAGTDQELRIANGLICGDGTVDAHLTLQNNATIAPGIGEGAVGRIDVLKSFQMTSWQNTMAIDLNAQGDMDLIAVVGNATLNGYCDITTSTAYQPAFGVVKTFLTYAARLGTTDLSIRLYPGDFTWMNNGDGMQWDYYYSAWNDPNPHETSWWITTTLVG